MYRNIVKHFKRSWLQHFPIQFATLVVLTGTFVVVSISILLYQNFDQLLTRWGDAIRLSVYLKEDIGKRQVQNIEFKLHKLIAGADIEYISKEKAASLFQKKMSAYAPELLNDPELTKNPSCQF